MGLLSKIKKGLKKIGNAVKKVVKPILKPIRKALENKWVRGLLMATTFFTGAGAIMGAFQAGGLKAAASATMKHLVNVGVKIVRAPLDLVSGGLKMAGNIASGLGQPGIGEFVSGLGKGLTARVDSVANAANNIFSSSATATNAASAPSTFADATRDQSGALSSPVSAPANTMRSVTEQMAPPQNLMQSPVSAAPLVEKPSLMKQALGWAERNPELTKIGVDMVAGATAPDEYTREDEMRDTRRMWGEQGASPAGSTLSANPFTSGTGMSMLQQLRQRNQQTLAPQG